MNGPTINGDKYALVVLKVLERDETGRPAKVLMGYDDTTFSVEEGAEFLTAFVKADLVKPATAKQ